MTIQQMLLKTDASAGPSPTPTVTPTPTPSGLPPTPSVTPSPSSVVGAGSGTLWINRGNMGKATTQNTSNIHMHRLSGTLPAGSVLACTLIRDVTSFSFPNPSLASVTLERTGESVIANNGALTYTTGASHGVIVLTKPLPYDLVPGDTLIFTFAVSYSQYVASSIWAFDIPAGKAPFLNNYTGGTSSTAEPEALTLTSGTSEALTIRSLFIINDSGTGSSNLTFSPTATFTEYENVGIAEYVKNQGEWKIATGSVTSDPTLTIEESFTYDCIDIMASYTLVDVVPPTPTPTPGPPKSWVDLGALGKMNNGTSNTTAALVPSTTAQAGEIVILTIARDNPAAGATNDSTAVSDTSGNTWTKVGEYSQAAANAGATVAVWYSKLTTALTTASTITATFATARTAKAMFAHRFSAAGTVLSVLETKTLAVSGQPGSMTSSTFTGGGDYLYFRAIAGENKNTSTISPTAGWTATDFSLRDGGLFDFSGTSSMRASGEFIITSSSPVTSNPTYNTGDHASLLITFKNEIDPALSPTPTPTPTPTISSTPSATPANSATPTPTPTTTRTPTPTPSSSATPTPTPTSTPTPTPSQTPGLPPPAAPAVASYISSDNTNDHYGFIYDISYLGSMWQDDAGTIPAAVDSPVGRVNDLGPNGLHATQSVSSKRPILRQSGSLYYLEFDGVDDQLDAPGLGSYSELVGDRFWMGLGEATTSTIKGLFNLKNADNTAYIAYSSNGVGGMKGDGSSGSISWGSVDFTTPKLLEVCDASGSAYTKLDGTTLPYGSPSVSVKTTALTFGWSSGYGSSYGPIKLYCFYMTKANGSHTTQEITDINAWANALIGK